MSDALASTQARPTGLVGLADAAWRRHNGHDRNGRRLGVLVAFDDTDDAQGGCTTAVVFGVLAAVPHLALAGMPRLVRLNPNVPYKTRGNAAVCLELVARQGPQVQVGLWDGHPIHARPEGARLDAGQIDEAARAVAAAVLAARRPGADPGVTVWAEPPPATVYWAAVRSRVEPEDATPLLADAVQHAGGRGRVGAMAAAAWPGPAASHELIVYRRLDRIGTPRDVQGHFQELDAQGVTFHSYDLEQGVRTCVPNTPCPVLCGLRGLDPERLLRRGLPALEAAIREPTAGWLLFATNQASGDHVSPVDDVQQAPEWGTIEVPATVDAAARDVRGGHVELALHDPRGHTFTAFAFEPTKGFRDVVRALRPGDRIRAVGAWDGGVRLEKLRVDHLAAPELKIENPRCPQCRRSMKSRGQGAGFRCPDGHGKAPDEAARRIVEPRTLRLAWYEVPVIARRHLHRPVALDAIPARDPVPPGVLPP